MQAAVVDNPASRLLQILEAGRKHPGNANCRAVWLDVLKAGKDNAELNAKIGKVMQLPLEIIDLLKEHYGAQGDTWSHWSTQVATAFMSQNLNSNWASFSGHIDDHTIMYLRMAVGLLDAKISVRRMSDENLKKLYASFTALLAEILHSDLDSSLKKFLVDHLRRIVSAIEDYSISGGSALLDSLEVVVGHAYLDPSYRTFLTSTELGARILESLSVAANLVTVAVGVPQLAQVALLIANS